MSDLILMKWTNFEDGCTSVQLVEKRAPEGPFRLQKGTAPFAERDVQLQLLVSRSLSIPSLKVEFAPLHPNSLTHPCRNSLYKLEQCPSRS